MCSDRRPRFAALAALAPIAPLALLALLELLGASACGKKGDPLPPPRAVPAAVHDLALVQRGGEVLLECGHPQATIAGLALPPLESLTLYELDRPAPAAGQPIVVAPQELAGARPALELAGAELAAAIAGDRIRLTWKLPDPLPDPPVARAFAVKTRAARGATSDFSNVAVLVPRPAPPAPAELTVTALKAGVQVAWSRVEEAAQGYAVLRRAASATSWGAPLARPDRETTTWLDATARYGQRYVYTVLALAAREPDVESALRAEREIEYEDHFAPAPPAALRALALPGEVHLVWEASPDADVAGYRLERASAGGEFALVGPAATTGLEYVDSGLASESTWRYRVAAVDNAGNVSAPGAPVEVRVP